MKFDFKNWDIGGKIIFISSCLAAFSFLLPWVDIGIINRNGFSMGTFLLFSLFLYPLLKLLTNKPIAKTPGIIYGLFSIIATILFYLSRSVGNTNVSGLGVYIYLISSIGLVFGVIKYKLTKKVNNLRFFSIFSSVISLIIIVLIKIYDIYKYRIMENNSSLYDLVRYNDEGIYIAFFIFITIAIILGIIDYIKSKNIKVINGVPIVILVIIIVFLLRPVI